MKVFYPKQGSSGFKHECLHVSPPPPPSNTSLECPRDAPCHCKLQIGQNSKFIIPWCYLVTAKLRYHFSQRKTVKTRKHPKRGRGGGAECRKEFYCNFILIILKKWTLKLRLVSMFYCGLFNENSLFCFVHQSSIPCKSLAAQKIYLY